MNLKQMYIRLFKNIQLYVKNNGKQIKNNIKTIFLWHMNINYVKVD